MSVSHRSTTIDITSTPTKGPIPVNTLLAPPDPSTRRASPRYRPYDTFVERGFDRSKTTERERNFYRWLYRAFRSLEHASAFSARAQFASTLMAVDEIKIDAAVAAKISVYAEGRTMLRSSR